MSAVAQKPPQTTYSEVPFSYKNPNKSYAPILALGEERNLILVTSKDETSGKIFAIKRLLSFSQARNPQIRQVPHENVVTIREMMLHENFIFIVYEKMRICLADIIALPIEIDEHHVATICTEVLKGLQHMHEVLNLRHGAITRTSILFSEDGVVKIGNFDQALWREIHSDTASDIKALQTVVQSLRLVWSENAHVFLRDMCEKSARALLKSNFLAQSPGPRSLEPHVLFATITANMPWRFCRTIVSKSA
ncbi:hypothetical protein MPH_13459 [Macrophomina phaseolina MS6]|uniref:Protein kinase domain-containing protein n=1 Tax=Macrophomina phaseolina (strain MS6) TaxID=1126212 RepID=K2RHD9_MACPH|nr:hypothetical protein MPH_13459 [Macrophomina phaseolina MS6]